MQGTLGGAREEHDDAIADARRWGIDPELLGETELHDGVWPENEDAVQAFLAVSTQWRFAGGGMGGVMAVGLDYQSARAGLDLAGISVTPELWAQLRVIETAARGALNERFKR